MSPGPAGICPSLQTDLTFVGCGGIHPPRPEVLPASHAATGQASGVVMITGDKQRHGRAIRRRLASSRIRRTRRQGLHRPRPDDLSPEQQRHACRTAHSRPVRPAPQVPHCGKPAVLNEITAMVRPQAGSLGEVAAWGMGGSTNHRA